MTHRTTNASAACGPRAARVMLVVADAERRRALRELVANHVSADCVDDLGDVLDAILQAARRPPDLLLLDHAIDGAAAPALITNLNRVAPSTEVLVFDDLAENEDSPGDKRRVLSWPGLTRALHAWFDGRVDRAGARAS